MYYQGPFTRCPREYSPVSSPLARSGNELWTLLHHLLSSTKNLVCKDYRHCCVTFEILKICTGENTSVSVTHECEGIFFVFCLFRVFWYSTTPLACRHWFDGVQKQKQRSFWTTHVKQKWGIFPFNIPWRYEMCLAMYLYSYWEKLPKTLGKIAAH